VRRGVSALAGVWLALVAPAAAAPVEVYGIELEVRGEQERVLVFADAPLAARLEELDAERLLLVLPGAVLDDSAPRRVDPPAGGTVLELDARELHGAVTPEVQVEIRRRADAEPELVQRGDTLAVAFERPRLRAADGLALRFEDAELAQVVETIARATGETFLFDDRLSGRITIALSDRVTSAEALDLLHAALALAGFAAVSTPSGAQRILPIANVPEVAPWRAVLPSAVSSARVATLLRLHAASAESVAAGLAPWLGNAALAVPHGPTNGLILVGAEDHLQRLVALAGALDAAAERDLLVRRVRHRRADELAALLEDALPRDVPAQALVEVWSDPRANVIVARAEPARLAELRRLIERLDRPLESDGAVRVLSLRYADPEQVAERLRALAAGGVDPQLGPAALDLRGRAFGVAVDRATASLVVRADPETFAILSDLLEALDQPVPRVYVEVSVLEVLSSQSLALALDAFIPLGVPDSPDDPVGSVLLNPSGGGLLQPGSGDGPSFAARFTRQPIVIPIVQNGVPVSLILPRESVVITAEQQVLASRVLARPHLLAASGEEHEISVGDNVPILVSAADAASDSLQTRANVERHDVGVRLRVRPSLGQGERIRLELDVETSRLAMDTPSSTLRQVGAVIRQRRLTTTVWLADDEVALVGGALQRDLRESQIGTPWLRSVPILGALFRRDAGLRLDSRLLVVAQARLQRDAADDVTETIRRRLGLERVMARVEPLRGEAELGWALRVASRRREDDAVAIADHFTLLGETAQVVRWEWAGSPRHDVVLTGYATLSQAADAALRARDAGFTPELLVVPPRDE